MTRSGGATLVSMDLSSLKQGHVSVEQRGQSCRGEVLSMETETQQLNLVNETAEGRNSRGRRSNQRV